MNNKQTMWIDKHRPKAMNELKGHGDVIKKAIAIINTYSSSKPIRKLIVLTGPPGTGKTLLAETLAKSSNIEFVKINCSASRSFAELKELIDPYITSVNSNEIYGSKMVLMLDELDGQLKANKFFDYLSKILMVNTNPIIATCNDAYRLPSSFLEHQCEVMKFQRQYDSTIRNILIDIAIKEGHKISTDDIDKLIIKGDIRASISSLQIYCMSGYVIPQIERDQNIFSQTQSVLTQKTVLVPLSPKDKYEDSILSFIEENGSIRATGLDRYHFYNIINHVSSLIHQYRNDEARKLIGMISYSSTYPQPTPDTYTPYVKTITPSIITKLSLTKYIRKTIKSLSHKISPDYLTSSRDFFEFIFPILQNQCITDINFARHISLKYNLEPPEIALLLDTTASDPRINKIIIPDKALTKSLIIPDKNTQTELEMFA